MKIDHHYAREKLTLLLRDLDSYNGDEFWRQMSRIAHGATDHPSAEELLKERDSLQHLADWRGERINKLAAHVERLQATMNEASNKHIAFAKRIMHGCDSTAMAAVDKADALLVRESFHVPVDTSHLARRDTQQKRLGINEACDHILSMGSKTHKAFITHDRHMYISTRALKTYAETLLKQSEATP